MKRIMPIKKAFSLLELSIVILIVSVLIAGVITTSSSVISNAKIKTANDRIKEIYKAMGAYAVANGRLPCPAPITDVKGSTNYGSSRADGLGQCNQVGASARLSGIYPTSDSSIKLVYGMVPVQDLNLSFDMAEDGFGSRFAYVVDERFTGFNKNNTGNNFNAAPMSSVITIQGAIDSSDVNNQTFTNDAAFVIVSYGANKYGAYPATSATQNARSSDSREQENDLNAGSFDSKFIASSGRSDVFDDVVFYKTKKDFMIDFNLMSLMTCQPTASHNDDISLDGGTTFTSSSSWDETQYGQVAVSKTSCAAGYRNLVLYPRKKCGAFGDWESGAVASCVSGGAGSNGNGSGGGGGGGGGGGTSALNCSGGTSSTYGGNTIRTFTASGTLSCTGTGTLNYLIVGGGGGGGGANTDGGAGGGGGGGVKTGSYSVSNGATISVVVGDGGTGGASGGSAAAGGTGGTSSLGSIASATGGTGGGIGGNQLGGQGGSSGLGDSSVKTGGIGQTCDPTGPGTHGGGGGGASMASAGGNGQSTAHGDHSAGAGANGTSNSITGTSITYGSGGGGGGGGGSSEGTVGAAGLESGGSGSGGSTTTHGTTNSIAPVAGVTNKGGGGGGGGKSNNGKAGGSGVVIVSYTTPS